ncbi:hypothetical protein [Roseibium sediminis]|uniref:hyaluronate lyase N-terminal domain-containing protein n=1 Tax=Roseibium sediminis TaxID=1775174 RepID=UPI00123D8EE8|nr:hypothetical protein [Roseibium sediminis]
MAVQRRRRAGTTAEHANFVGVPTEMTINDTEWTIHVHDGQTPGGHPLAKRSELAELASSQSVAELKQGISGHVTNVSEVVLDLAPFLENGWGTFELDIDLFDPDTQTAQLLLFVSADGGISWDTSYSNTGWYLDSANQFLKYNAVTTQGYLIGPTQSRGRGFARLVVTPTGFNCTTRSSGVNENGAVSEYDFTIQNGSAINAIRLFASGGVNTSELRYSLRKIVRP